MTARLDVQLDSPHVTLAPGDAGQVHLTVSNQGDIVDAGLLSIGGLAAEWFTLPPGDVRLFPGESATVVLDLHPPDTAGPAGIQALSMVRPITRSSEALGRVRKISPCASQRRGAS